MRTARTISAAAIGVALVATAPWLGWWTLALFAAALVNLATFEWRKSRSDRPERVAAGSLIFTVGLLAVGVAFSGGPESPMLPWLVIPIAMAATRFRGAVVLAFGVLIGVVALVVCLVVDPRGTVSDPVPLLTLFALLVSVGAGCMALIGGEIKHRDSAVLDPLTGLLNRNAMQLRMVELELQAHLTGDSVCFVACDLDAFKRVNDSFGHDRGDEVLRAVAHELRTTLRSFELLYRIGGEEFLVVLPGAGMEEGLATGERLRLRLHNSRPGGLELTMSLGVSAAAGDGVHYDSLFKAADEALYAAKRAGRNRVIAAPAPTPTVTTAPRAVLAAAG